MMKKLILMLLFALSPLAASAGSLTITLTVGTNTFTFTKSIADTDLTGKLSPWLLANYANTCSPQPCTPATTTNATAFALWIGAFLQGTINNVQTWQALQVQQQALTATPVAPINPQ